MDFEASHILHIKFQEQFHKGKIKLYFLQINLRGNQVQKAGKRKINRKEKRENRIW